MLQGMSLPFSLVVLFMGYFFDNGRDRTVACSEAVVRGLIHLERHDHLEDGDVDLEVQFVVEVFHCIGAIHLSHFGAEIATTDVLIAFSGIQDRLDADDAFAFYLAVASIAVEDMPVTAM